MKSAPATSGTLPVQHFEHQQDWADWLAEHHLASPGLWLQLARKGTDVTSVSYDEAVEIALCFGWIDGQKQSHSDLFWLQKFTPRTDRSLWSKLNRDKALALIAAGKMQSDGLREVERAKRDGRWDAAYDSVSKATVPDDL